MEMMQGGCGKEYMAYVQSQDEHHIISQKLHKHDIGLYIGLSDTLALSHLGVVLVVSVEEVHIRAYLGSLTLYKDQQDRRGKDQAAHGTAAC